MLQLNFTPFPVLHTQRLLLREMVQKDAPELFFLRSDEKVLQFIGREPAKTITEVEEFIQKIHAAQVANESILWAIALKDEPATLIGSICYWRVQPENYRAEIGYNLHPDHWGRGIITEAINKVVDYGFTEMKLHSIEARTSPENIGSGAALEKAGFVKEGHLKEEFFFGGKFFDSVIYSRLQKK
ncbi:MAG TPA: GNAT family N-acetyltransferase [Chitinophagaceae bacterium]|jgi:ribosomal-protein-alanine N-acetyltransferase|nr:GNAT family N-acetyltransferase [Chitinophagaceae bacterium]